MPRLTRFDGLAPKIDPQDQQPNGAVVAENCDLYGGRIDPHPALGDVGTPVTVDGELLVGRVSTLYRAGPVWVGFVEDTFVAPDPSERAGEDSFLFVRDGQLWRSSAAWILDKQGPVRVGISPPRCPPTASLLAGGGTALVFPAMNCDGAPDPNDISCNVDADAPEARAYVVTYVTTCDEESAPSLPSGIVDVRNGDSVVLVDSDVPPDNAVARRWYRSIAGADGLAVWLFVAETPIAAPGYVDDVPSMALGEALPTEDHLPPPTCLQGVAVLGDAVTLVWSGDQFWMSEPRLPHAYPPLWRKRLRFPILAVLGVTADTEGQETYLGYVVTTGAPYFLSGVGPEDVTPREYSLHEPGASRHCACIAEGSLVYASTRGLIQLRGPNAASILSPEVTEIEWQQFDPAGLKLAHDNGRLWGFAPLQSFVLPGSHYREDRGRFLTTLTLRADGVFAGPDTPLTVVQSGQNGARLQQWGAGTGVMRSRWRSRVFTMPGEWWPAAAKVVADFPRESVHVTRARRMLAMWEQQHGDCRLDQFFNHHPELRRFEPELSSLRPHVTLRLFADGVEYYSRALHSSRPVRVPPRRAIDWQVEVGGDLPIREVHFETSIQDLVQLGLGVGNSV
jgi:hypothetical protein